MKIEQYYAIDINDLCKAGLIYYTVREWQNFPQIQIY